jgi:FeS assembly SUF system regulator
MLKLTRLADYAFVVLRHLAQQDQGTASAREIAQAAELPVPTVSKLLKQLASAGLVCSERGVRGGYRLAKNPDVINVADVIAAVDGPVALTECATHGPDCPRMDSCTLRPNWLRINALVRRVLKDISLDDMTQPLAAERLGPARPLDEPGA